MKTTIQSLALQNKVGLNQKQSRSYNFGKGSTQCRSEPGEKTRKEKCKKIIILASLFMVYLLVGAAYSIIAPFYPQEVR